jgi:hypothetical protein
MAARIRPHTINDLDRYGPLALQPLPLSSTVWDGAEFSADEMAALRFHFLEHIAPRIEATCANDPARYFEILACLRPHLFDSPATEG